MIIDQNKLYSVYLFTQEGIILVKRLWNYLTIYDKVLIISLIILSVIFILSPLAGLLIGGDSGSNHQEMEIVIQAEDGRIRRIFLEDTYRDEAMIIPVRGPLGLSYIEAHNGRVRVKEAPANDPLKICEHTGWIDQIGPMIICVPNKISVWIEAKESEIDGVSW